MGIILYELCMLKVPFDGPSIAALVQKICCGPTPSIQQGGAYSDFTRNLCSEMLNRAPTMRPTAEAIIDRPRIKGIVRQMFEEAKSAQERGEAEGGGADEAAPGGAPGSAPGVGHYRKGDLVEYYSNTHKYWLPATVINVDNEGSVIIDLKQNSWITLEQQRQQLRPRKSSVTTGGSGNAAPAATPPGNGRASPPPQQPQQGGDGAPVSSAPQGADLDLAFEQLCAELELDEPAASARAAADGEVDITVLDGEVEESPAVIITKLEDQVGDVCLTDAELELLEKHSEADGSLSLPDT